jgi:hypothetical protein
MMPETRNPFASARILGRQVDQSAYRQDVSLRGTPGYVMSRSELTEFMHCPARWKAGYVRKDTDATDWGTLMDALLLDRNNFDNRFAVAPAMYPCEPTKRDPRTEKPWNNNATFCDEWCKAREAEGKTVLSAALYNDAQSAIGRLLSDPDIDMIIAQSDKQVHVLAEYHDRDTDIKIPVQALIDIVPPKDDQDFGKSLMDFKTCSSAFPFVCERAVFERNYHVQSALYLDAYTLATGEDRCDFRHILQESFFPWQPGKRFMSVEFLALGRLKVVAALRFYCACLADHWPNYERTDGKLNFNGFEICEPLPYMIGQ